MKGNQDGRRFLQSKHAASVSGIAKLGGFPRFRAWECEEKKSADA
jgi:hypothetical protein